MPKSKPKTVEPLPAGLRLEWRNPSELAENPANWRRHPEAQTAALADVIAEVGWAGACLFNETTGLLIDGHARRKLAIDQGVKRVPVLIGSWTPEQEAKILATLDPIAAMAQADAKALDAILKNISTDSPALQQLLDSLAAEASLASAEPVPEEQTAGVDTIAERFQVLVDCQTEAQQGELLEQLSAQGLKCRSLMS